jgi:hypothetical protein
MRRASLGETAPIIWPYHLAGAEPSAGGKAGEALDRAGCWGAEGGLRDFFRDTVFFGAERGEGGLFVAEAGFPAGAGGTEERGGVGVSSGEVVVRLIVIAGRDEAFGGEGGGAGELAAGFGLGELLRGPLRANLGEIGAKLWGLKCVDLDGERV